MEFQAAGEFGLERTVVIFAAYESLPNVMPEFPEPFVFPGGSVFGEAGKAGKGDADEVEKAESFEAHAQIRGTNGEPLRGAARGYGIAVVDGVDKIEGA